MNPRPAPPSSSATETPSQPSSARSAHALSCGPSQSRSSGKRSASQPRAWRFSSCCSSVKEKSISTAPRQIEHALGDDVARHLGGAPLDRVAAAAQLLGVPPAVVEDPALAEQLAAELRQPL